MLSKADGEYNIDATLTEKEAEQSYSSGNSYFTLFETTVDAGDYYFECEFRVSGGTGMVEFCTKNGTSAGTKYYSTTYSGTTYTKIWFKQTGIAAGTTIAILANTNWSNNNFYIKNQKIVKRNTVLTFNQSTPWKPRELNTIGNNSTITIFWVHTDNNRLSDNLFTISWALEYVKSKWEQHVNSSGSSYTAKWYGYCTYTIEYNNGSAYVKVNWITICLISGSWKNTSNIFFFKPWDIITFVNATSRTIYDYY